MTNKIKTLLLIVGLMACLIVTLIAKTEITQSDTEVETGIDSPSVTTQVIVNTGAQWVIQTTYKILKPNQ